MATTQEVLERGMTVDEMVANGISKKEADLEMARRVFGHDVQFDRHGKPIEQGRGSIGQHGTGAAEKVKFIGCARHENQGFHDIV